ncbi:MAG: hypothetical protein V1492_01890 [Candidatus Micrarchaeota archaeon]
MNRAGLFAFLLVLSFIAGCVMQQIQTPANSNVSSRWILNAPEVKNSGKWIAQAPQARDNVTALVITAPNCEKCVGADLVLANYEQEIAGSEKLDKRRIDPGSDQGKELIQRYRIEKLPTLLLMRNDAWDYITFSNWLNGSGTMEADNTLVLRKVQLPYYDVKTGQVQGMVHIMLLVNGSNSAASATADAMAASYNLVYTKLELNASSIEAQQAMTTYNIAKLPAILISPEAAVYPGFTQAWLAANNTIEKDGTFVLR